MKKSCFAILFALFIGVAFAQTVSIDDALASKNKDAVKTILESSNEENLKEVESKIITDIKKAVNEDDLDYAYDLADLILMYDFDNKEAQKLYTSIEKAKKNKAEQIARQQEEERRKKEEEEKRIKAEEEKRRMEEYYALKEKDEVEAAKAKDDYIESVSSIGWKNFPMEFGFSPLAFDISSSSFANQYNDSSSVNFRYGLGVSYDLSFIHPYVVVDLLVDYQFYVWPVAGAGMKSDLLGRVGVGLPGFSEYFRLTLGYKAMDLISSENIALYTHVKSPTLGCGVDKIKLGKDVYMGCYIDWDLITLDANSTIDLAGGIDLILKYDLPFTVKNIKFFISNETKFDFIRVSNQSEWSINTIFNFGAKLNG